MKLLWSPRSPFVRKVMVAAHEVGALDRIALVRCMVPTLDPDHPVYQYNPLGTIPVLIIENRPPLIGSAAIIEHLDLGGKQGLVPASDPERQQALQLQTVADGMLDLLVPWQAMLRNGVPAHQEASIRRSAIKLEKVLAYFDTRAADFALSPFQVGQIAAATMLSYLDFRHPWRVWRDDFPDLRDWYDQVRLRPSFVQTDFVDEERIAP